MSDQEQKRPNFVESVGNLTTSPVVGEGLSELRAAGDREELLHETAPWFGSQEAGEDMVRLGQSGPVKLATDLMSPFALAGGIHEMKDDIAQHHYGKAALDS